MTHAGTPEWTAEIRPDELAQFDAIDGVTFRVWSETDANCLDWPSASLTVAFPTAEAVRRYIHSIPYGDEIRVYAVVPDALVRDALLRPHPAVGA